MAFAIIQNGGKQYIVEEGKTVSLEKMDVPAGEKVTFSLVVLSSDGTKTDVGTPFLEGKTVEGEVVEEGRADKIRVVHKQSKKRMMRVRGHRQPFTLVKITKI